MKIVEPAVFLEGLELPVKTWRNNEGKLVIQAQCVDDRGIIDLSGPLKLIEQAGRTCYKSEGAITPESYKVFAQKIQTLNHMSVVEHSGVTIRSICDRGVSHELVRHRLAAFSQESTRYCNYAKEKFGGEITVIRPPLPEGCEHYGANSCPGHGSGNCPKCVNASWAQNSWEASVLLAEKSYFELLEYGCTPQIARSVLPTCLKTEIVMTCNFREWKHVMLMRTSKSAHPQMKQLADMIYEILLAIAPEVFSRPLTREERLESALKSMSFSSAMENNCLVCERSEEEGHETGCVIGEALGEKMEKKA